ncbi:transposable element Tcb2 transposase [Trichonephila clavipes]|nr:transposable element Tcb2 transposase [Trichonephila clavipes]
MDDNRRPRRANLVEDFLFEEGIVRMEWPASSPDMNPIEHVWDALGRRVAGHQPPPQTPQEPERALLEESSVVCHADSIIDLFAISKVAKASITAEVSACSEDGVLAGYVICTLIRSKDDMWDLDRGSEKASPVFEHPFRQTTSVQASMYEWSSYPAGREIGLPRYIAIELGVQHCPECPRTSQSSCFQSQELTDPGQTTRNTPTLLCFHHQT